MNFCVCIKQVPDVSASVDTGRNILNAYDASAVEEALRMREKHGGTIHVLLIGPEKASETIRKALAMGADSATHIVIEDVSGADSKGFATLLARYLGDRSYDVVACGKQAQDTDAGLTGGMLAEMLQLSYASNAVGLDVEGAKLIVTRQGDSGQEIIALSCPCLVTCSNDMNDPRIAALKGIMAAKKKQIEKIEDWTLPVAEVVFQEFEALPSRPAGTIIEGEPAEAVSQLVDKLLNEAKVIG